MLIFDELNKCQTLAHVEHILRDEFKATRSEASALIRTIKRVLLEGNSGAQGFNKEVPGIFAPGTSLLTTGKEKANQ